MLLALSYPAWRWWFGRSGCWQGSPRAEALATILTSFGIEEDDRKEMQADFVHLRKWCKSVEQAQNLTFRVVLTAIVTGFVGACWLGFKALLGKQSASVDQQGDLLSTRPLWLSTRPLCPSPVGNRIINERNWLWAIRCKMQLEDVMRRSYGSRKAFFRCSYDQKLSEEDVGFQKATPPGSAEFMIGNPKATEQLVIGEYYVDFHPVPKPEPKAA